MRLGGASSWAFLLLAMAACDESNTPPPMQPNDAPLPTLERSGSRLQARGFELEGLFAFDGFYDTLLGVLCDRGKAADGSERCLPRTTCATEPVPAPDPSTLVAFTSTSEVPLGSGFAAIVANGEDGSRAGTGELVDQGTRCAVTPGTCGESAASSCASPLVDGAISRGPLVERTKTTTDGSPVARSALFDPALGDECRFERTADGTVRCVPAHVATVQVPDLFSDAACTRILFEAPACTPKYVRYEESCGAAARYFAVVTLTGQAFTRAEDGSCVPAEAKPGLVGYGTEVDPAQLAQGQPALR